MQIPFEAFSGEASLAVALNAISPLIGGVLLVGPCGSGKTALARSSRGIHPEYSFDDALVTVPQSVTEENLLGSMDMGHMLRCGERRLRPGILARVEGRILLLDDVNLLPDRVTDHILDCAAGGVFRAEVDGFSVEVSAEFVLIGTMDSSAGSLRPQLMDRFGMLAAMPEGSVEHRLRVAEMCLSDGISTSRSVRRQVAQARTLIRRIKIPSWCLPAASIASSRLNLDGQRSESALVRGALALAAYHQRGRIEQEDLLAVAPLVLCHRTRNRGADRPPLAQEARDAVASAISHAKDTYRGATALHLDQLTQKLLNAALQGIASAGECDGWSGNAKSLDGLVTSVWGGFPKYLGKKVFKEMEDFAGKKPGGGKAGGSTTGDTDRGRRVRIVPSTDPGRIDPLPTVKAALLGGMKPPLFPLESRYWKHWKHSSSAKVTAMLVVDASRSSSGYLLGLSRMLEHVFASVFDPSSRVGLVVIENGVAQLRFSPTRNRLRVFGRMRELSPGGYTPLTEALRIAGRELGRTGASRGFLLLISDCYPEPLPPMCRSPWESDLYSEVRREAEMLGRRQIPVLIIDPSPGIVGENNPGRRLGRFIARTSGGVFASVPAEEMLKSGFYTSEDLDRASLSQNRNSDVHLRTEKLFRGMM